LGYSFLDLSADLALSRALGDFRYKKNRSLPPEKQIITADPDVSVHDITEEDEFLVIACDGSFVPLFILSSGINLTATVDIGIWDCLSSQQVLNFVRLKISQGKELAELSEMICDHCLAPDTSHGPGMGTDNMTFLVVAILGGRTKEEWQSWITDRVKGNYGYATPTASPQLYAENRLRSFKARQEARAEREAKEVREAVGAARVKRQASEETLKPNVQESDEEMDRARTPTIPDSDDSAGDLSISSFGMVHDIESK
jgi:protein phosphatase PTC2/3